MTEPLNEKTAVSLSFSSWWQVLIIIAVIIGAFIGLKSDTETALALGRQNQVEQRQTQTDIYGMRMDVRSVTDDVKWFRQQYEHDMSRYVREPGDKRSQ